MPSFDATQQQYQYTRRKAVTNISTTMTGVPPFFIASHLYSGPSGTNETTGRLGSTVSDITQMGSTTSLAESIGIICFQDHARRSFTRSLSIGVLASRRPNHSIKPVPSTISHPPTRPLVAHFCGASGDSDRTGTRTVIRGCDGRRCTFWNRTKKLVLAVGM